MKLSHIFLDDCIVVVLCFLLTVLVVIDSFLAVALNDLLPKQLDRLVRNLTFARSLFGCLQERNWVLGPTTLVAQNKRNKTKRQVESHGSSTTRRTGGKTAAAAAKRFDAAVSVAN